MSKIDDLLRATAKKINEDLANREFDGGTYIQVPLYYSDQALRCPDEVDTIEMHSFTNEDGVKVFTPIESNKSLVKI